MLTCEKLGLSILAVVAYTPSWSAPHREDPPGRTSDFVNFCRTVAQRYASCVSSWSIWNEPNLRQFWTGSRDAFLELWIAGMQELRHTLPEATLVGPDLSSAKNNRCLQDWFPTLLRHGRALLNVISHHQYDGNDTSSGRLIQVDRVHGSAVANGCSHLPLWITETGWSREHISPEKQAQLLTDFYEGMRSRPYWKRTFWYDSHGPLWGLLETETLAPFPSYNALSALEKTE